MSDPILRPAVVHEEGGVPVDAGRTSPGVTKNLLLYFVLAYALSWAIEIPLALAHRGIIAPLLPPWMHYFTAYGPALAALIAAGACEGRAGLRDLASRLGSRWVRPAWWLVALSPLLLGLIVGVVVGAATGTPIRPADLGVVNFLPPLGVGALALWILTFGLGEETGWRGYALPRLQRGRSALRATVILAALWALWHLPAFFYLFEPAIAPIWLVGLFAGAVVFTWLFNSSGGSILVVALWHGCFNYVSSSDAGGGLLGAVVSIVVIVWAVVVIAVFRPADLARGSKVEVPAGGPVGPGRP